MSFWSFRIFQVDCDPHKGFGIVNKAEIVVFLELSCFFHDLVDVGNLISGSSAFSPPRQRGWCWGLCTLQGPLSMPRASLVGSGQSTKPGAGEGHAGGGRGPLGLQGIQEISTRRQYYLMANCGPPATRAYGKLVSWARN